MSRSVQETKPFDYLIANQNKYQGVKFEITELDENHIDFVVTDSSGKRLDKFELYPLVCMLVDTQLRVHPAFGFVDSILADFDNAWNVEYATRVAEEN